MFSFNFIMIGASVFVLGLGGVAVYFLVQFMKKAQGHIETIEKTPLTGAGRLQPGLNKSTGKAVALDEPVISPLTQTPCVFYHFKIEEMKTSQRSDRHTPRRSRGNNINTYWETVISDKQAVRCGVQDDTGMALVDLLGAEMELKTSAPKQSSVFSSAAPELQETLKRRYDFSTKGLLLSKSLRYTEMIIRPGDQLFVMGDVETDGGEPTFVKREHAFIVSDKGEAELVKHYGRKILGYKITMGIAAAVALLFASFPIFAVSMGGSAKPPAVAENKPKPAAPAPQRKQQVREIPDNLVQVAARPEPTIAPPAEPKVVPPPEAVAAIPVQKKTPALRDENPAPPAEKPAPPAEKPAPASPSSAAVPVNTKVHLVCAAGGRALEAEKEKNNRNGSKVVLRPRDGRNPSSRQWVIKPVAGGDSFSITNVESNRVLDGERASSRRDGTKVQLYGTDVDGNKERLWQFQSAGSDAVYIVNVANGRYLDADPAALDKKVTTVRLWGQSGDDKPQRKWKVVKVKP